MWAIQSDIHGNLEALQAVLADVDRQHVDQIICLGDIVGFGTDSLECQRMSTSWSVVLRGDFEAAVTADDVELPWWSASAAARSVMAFRRMLQEQPDLSGWLQYLRDLPLTHSINGVDCVHGSPRGPLHEYVFPEDIHNARKLNRISECFDRVCFNGHTHNPGIIVAKAPDQWQYVKPAPFPDWHRLDAHKSICNVGSVGQPRDGDWRAGYVLFDGETVRFRRVEYDIDTTIRKIRMDPDTDDFVGDRIREGK